MSLEIKRITVSDFTDYDSRYCRNGGKYGFWTNYTSQNGAWERSEHTTGEFCPWCGNWDCNGECPDSVPTDSIPKFNAEELSNLISGKEAEWEIQLPEAIEQPLVCPVCFQRTKYFVYWDTVAERLPLYCQRCKLTFKTAYRYGTQTSTYEGTAEKEFEPIPTGA